MKLSLIVAVSENNVIGREGGLPWHLSADLKRFKKLTMGHPILMGRKTFESLGRVLPGRTSIVISRQRNLELPADVVLAGSLDEALKFCRMELKAFIIGGAELYAAAIEHVDCIELTRVHASVDGDTFFPEIDWNQWECIADEPHEADEKNPFSYNFQTFVRKTPETPATE